MNECARRAWLLPQEVIPEVTAIQSVFIGAGLDTRISRLEDWVETGPHERTDLLVIILDGHGTCGHAINTALDLGQPVIFVKLPRAGSQMDGFQPHCALSWPFDVRYVSSRLEELSGAGAQQPTRQRRSAEVDRLTTLGMHGASPSFSRLLHAIKRFARSQAPILIQGETGSGKELVARALHYFGPRRNGPFIPVNCSSLPDSLFENELFGHARGAFTDAKEPSRGLVSQAAEGTLFLDEVDGLQPRAQASLLRFLQEKRYRQLGGDQYIEGRCSILAATNHDLEQMSRDGLFRPDLLYRLDAVTLKVPALRERPEDISLIARTFLRNLCDQYGQPPKAFHPATLHWMEQQPWPGNVRQLENYIHREFLLSERPIIKLDPAEDPALPQMIPCAQLPPRFERWSFNEMRDALVQDFERKYLHRLMQATNGNVSKAARLANKERRCLGKLLKKYEIDREQFVPERSPLDSDRTWSG
ncbi:sigma-54-dependent transcriptional regulator [Halochromatium glycolicum]|nr:sigma-54 dependent transcriptional regulator [Halochromatium glycolicum]